MAEMSFNRVVHGAVRRDLDRFIEALSTLGGGDGERRVEQVLTAWANFQDQLTRHHLSEHRIAWPALRKAGISDGLLTQLDAEHDRMAAALESAGEAMRSLRGTPSAERVNAAREAVAALRATTAEHLDHEDAELEPFLSEHADTPVMKEMGRAFQREYTMPEAGTYFAWLQDGASSDELAGLRQTVPGPVVSIITWVWGGKYRRTIAPAWKGRAS
jgi:hemerythrin-like domain-containing protein